LGNVAETTPRAGVCIGRLHTGGGMLFGPKLEMQTDLIREIVRHLVSLK
jgi:hypothetical protein